MQNILQLISLVATATLVFICYKLSRKQDYLLFTAVGQDVFRWLAGLLVALMTTRAVVYMLSISREDARTIGSVIYTACLVGIMLSVARHDSTDK